jgi:hypothetical protein
LICVLAPGFIVKASPDFYKSEEYDLILLSFAIAWLLGALISKINFGKINICPTLNKSVAALTEKSIAKITYIVSISLILYFLVSGNIGILSDENRLLFEGGVAHKIILINIFLIASYGMEDKKAFFLFFILAAMTGWKSIVLYAVVAFLIQFRINFLLLIKFLALAVILIIAFSIINMRRQGVNFSDMTLVSTVSILEIFYYYLAYGFLNFAYNLQQLSVFSLFLPLGIGGDTINPTWNVHSGFHVLINTLGILGGSIFMIGLRIVGSRTKNNGPIYNFCYYIMILTLIMFHNTFIALSPIVLIFPFFLYFLEKFIPFIKLLKPIKN